MATTPRIEDLTSKGNMRISRLEETLTNLEHCQNPWNPGCRGTDIELYILHEERKIPICGFCWRQIAESDLEW